MDTLAGTLIYTPKEKIPLKIQTKRKGIYNLYPLLEPSFWSLSGLYVEPTKNASSYELRLGGDWLFHYESRENMFLKKPNEREKPDILDVAAHLDALFSSLHGLEVAVEGSKEHFKISAVQQEQ